MAKPGTVHQGAGAKRKSKKEIAEFEALQLLTDAIKSLLIDEQVFGAIYDGEKFDCGSKEGFVHATIALALRDESISEKIKKIIKDIV